MSGGHDWTIWPVLLALGLATTLPRASFIVLGSRITLPPVVQRALRYAPAAALAAIVAPDLLLTQGQVAPLNPKLLAMLVVVAVASRWKNPWLPFIVGMAALHGLVALRAALG